MPASDSSIATSCPPLFDSHVHLDAAAFDHDRARVLRDARTAGVAEMLLPAVTSASWPKLAALCTTEPGLYPAYGLHPCFLWQHDAADPARLEAWLASHRAAAVGECGLDFFDTTLDRERQIRLLREQLRIAHRFDLPLVLHARQAFEAVLLELQGFGKPLRGVVHSFSGSAEQAQRFAGLGFLVGIGGAVTHERARRLRTTVAALPIESLLLETDAPDQPDAAHHGMRNEPAFLVEVLHCIAELRGDDPAALARATTANARRLFAPNV